MINVTTIWALHCAVLGLVLGIGGVQATEQAVPIGGGDAAGPNLVPAPPTALVAPDGWKTCCECVYWATPTRWGRDCTGLLVPVGQECPPGSVEVHDPAACNDGGGGGHSGQLWYDGRKETRDGQSTPPGQPAGIGQEPVAEPLASRVSLGYLVGNIDVNGVTFHVEGTITQFGDPNHTGNTGMIQVTALNDVAGPNLAHKRPSNWPPNWPSIELGPFIVPNSGMIEQGILTEAGDWAVLTVTFPGCGSLAYDITVVSADPVVFAIQLSGDLTGNPADVPLPWDRGLYLRFNEDGTVTGQGFAQATTADGQARRTSASISGTFYAAKPSVPLPAEMAGLISIESLDPSTGRWTAEGHRAVRAANDSSWEPIDGDDPSADPVIPAQASTDSGSEVSEAPAVHGPQTR